MHTEKRYYADCHLSRFTARVTDCQPGKNGYEIQLDATAFYPEGGGQACDVGYLGGSRVLDVRERGDRIIHLCDRPLAVGETVEGEIDYPRRFDLMQQHTGEHIVSGILHRRFGFHNTGFHIGAETVTVDFDGVLPPEALPEIEWEANQALWQDIPVRCWVPTPEELPGVPYRRKRDLPWPVRIVEIPGYDICACCGVHTARTGEVGMVKLLSAVGFRGGVRIEMVCGGRALRLLNAAYEQNRQVSQAFSAKMLETGEAARRMNKALEQEKYRCAQLLRQQFAGIAESYVNRGNVLHFADGLDSVQVRELADAIAQLCGGTAAVFSGFGQDYSYCLAARQGDLREFGRAMTSALHGRGGGKPGFQQGHVSAGREEIEAYLCANGF